MVKISSVSAGVKPSTACQNPASTGWTNSGTKSISSRPATDSRAPRTAWFAASWNRRTLLGVSCLLIRGFRRPVLGRLHAEGAGLHEARLKSFDIVQHVLMADILLRADRDEVSVPVDDHAEAVVPQQSLVVALAQVVGDPDQVGTEIGRLDLGEDREVFDAADHGGGSGRSG